jgi:hypothetical protein
VITEWIKATASATNGSCVEMRRNGAAVQLRDTKQHGTGPILTITPAAFLALLDGAKQGEFDRLA